MDPSSEAPRLGSIELLENMWRPFCIKAIANARLQLYAVAIKSFYIDIESYAILYCFTLGKPAGYEVGKNMAELYPWPGGHIIDESCIVCRQIRVVLDR